MEIRPATTQDKVPIMDFCRRIYPAGDYLEDTWDSWFAEGGLYAIHEDGACVGMFNVSIRSGQGWVEGTRVHPDYRRRKAGTMVLQYAEQLVGDRGGHIIRSFIQDTNTASLERARKAGWHRGELWGWYSLNPGGCSGFRRAPRRVLRDAKYADSWRIYDLEEDCKSTVFLEGAAATIIPSRRFPGTVIVTILEADDMSGLASYMHAMNPGSKSMHGWTSGLHITSNVDEGRLGGVHLTKISSYHLMSKGI